MKEIFEMAIIETIDIEGVDVITASNVLPEQEFSESDINLQRGENLFV